MKRLFIAVGCLILGFANQALAETSDPAVLFGERCERCHTFGGGKKKGPDLLEVVDYDDKHLRKAITKMQKKAGKLTPEQIDSLTHYVRQQANKIQAEKEKESKKAPADAGK